MISGLDKQVLQPIEGLEFQDDIHAYKINGKWLSTSVTSVLSFDMSDEAKANIEATRHEWEPRGNHLHACLEQFLRGAALLNPAPYEAWWQPVENCWLFDGATVLGTEVRLFDEKKSLAGSTDFLIRTKKGSVVLGDLKTVSSVESMRRRKPADAQLGAYLCMINEHYPNIYIDKCVTLVSAPDQCRVLSSDPDDCGQAWLEAWGRYKAHMDNKPF
jgi:hypothetical protein